MKESLKNLTSIALLLLLNVVSYSQRKDIEGWEQYRWGMSNEEIVRTADPRLTRLSETQTFFRAHVDYIIPKYELIGEVFTVYFQIDNATSKLTQILIRLNEQESKAPRVKSFHEVESLLIRQYGPSLDQSDESRTSVEGYKFIRLTRVWRFPTTTVELSYGWDNQIDASLLAIRYFPTKAPTKQQPSAVGSDLRAH